MKVAVSSGGQDLNSSIDPRFGRCAYFLIIETQDMSFKAHENQSATLGGGAGIQSAQFIVSQGAQAVITGNCGPNAVRTLAAAGIELFLQVTGTIKEAVEKYKKGELTPSDQANVAEHAGLGSKNKALSDSRLIQASQAGPGRVRGQGLGMGRGRGMQMGRGFGRGVGR